MVDEIVKRAMTKWPNAPALFGWLRLDRRGQWYLRGERIERDILTGFIGRNYESDEHGRWYFQNGPQRGFVELDYTPWILFSQPDGSLHTHTEQAVQSCEAAYLDETGNLILVCEHGPGLLSESDLDWALERFRTPQGEPPEEAALMAALEALQSGEAAELALEYGGRIVEVEPIRAAEAPERLGYVQRPEPLPEEERR